MITDDVETVLFDFTQGRRGWRIKEDAQTEAVYAIREFDLVKERVALVLRTERFIHGRVKWLAGAFMPFSVGAQSECSGSLQDCMAWINRRETTLAATAELVRANDPKARLRLIGALTGREVVWLETTVGIDVLRDGEKAPEARVPYLLSEFTEGRRGWFILATPDGDFVAWRSFRFGENQWRLELRLKPVLGQPDAQKWEMRLSAEDDGGVASSMKYFGSFPDPVLQETRVVEETLSRLTVLFESGRDAAGSIATTFRGRQLNLALTLLRLRTDGSKDLLRDRLLCAVTGRRPR